MQSISIIIVHWNVPDLLRDCLASIERESADFDGEIEIIVIDNASPSGTPDCDSHARLIALEENVGFSAANNIGAVEASGDALLFLNPDTELQPESLNGMMETLNLNPRIGLVAPLLLNSDGSVQSSGYRFPGVMNVICDLHPVPARIAGSELNGRVSPADGRLPYMIDYPLGAAMLMRAEAFRNISGFDADYFMYSEEVDLCQRLAVENWKRLLAPNVRIVHHGGRSTAQHPAEMIEMLWLSRARYYNRWTTGWRRKAISRLVEVGIGKLELPLSSRDRIKSAFRALR